MPLLATMGPHTLTALSINALGGDSLSPFEKLETFSSSALIGFALVILAFAVLMMVSYWRIYQKAGQPGWAAIIPIYNIIILLKIIKKPWWWILLFFVPIVNIVIGFLLFYYLAEAFGKSVGFALGLYFLGFIFLPILAFGDSQYVWGAQVGASDSNLPPQYPPPTPPPPMQ